MGALAVALSLCLEGSVSDLQGRSREAEGGSGGGDPRRRDMRGAGDRRKAAGHDNCGRPAPPTREV
jgi:hypothetical protein